MDESLGNRLVRQMKELAEVAGIKTEEYAKISRKRLDVISLDRELDKEKSALGGRVYELHRREGTIDFLQDVTVKACIARIQKLEESMAEVEREIQAIRGASQERASGVRQRYTGERNETPPEPGAGPKP